MNLRHLTDFGQRVLTEASARQRLPAQAGDAMAHRNDFSRDFLAPVRAAPDSPGATPELSDDRFKVLRVTDQMSGL